MTLNPSPTPDRPSVGSSGLGTSLSRLAGIGLQFGAVISLFALAGYWLDERIGSSPWLLLLGVLLGFAGGTVSLVKAVSRLEQNPDRIEQNSNRLTQNTDRLTQNKDRLTQNKDRLTQNKDGERPPAT